MADRLCNLKEQFISVVEGQMGNLSKVNAKELGEVVDIVKDLAEAMYYCKITEAMEKNSDEENQYYMEMYAPETRFYPMYARGGRMRDSRGRYMYTEPMMYEDREYMRDMDKGHDRMYYTSGGNSSGMSGGRGSGNGGSRSYYSPMDDMMHDPMMGKSHISRRGYMEAKHGGDKNEKNKELEMYMKDLGEDMAEMIEGLDSSEKQVVKQKLSALASKL